MTIMVKPLTGGHYRKKKKKRLLIDINWNCCMLQRKQFTLPVFISAGLCRFALIRPNNEDATMKHFSAMAKEKEKTPGNVCDYRY